METFGSLPIQMGTGLTIAAGDCGHGFKFAPVLGGIIADAVEGKVNPKFRWRPEVKLGVAKKKPHDFREMCSGDLIRRFGCRRSLLRMFLFWLTF